MAKSNELNAIHFASENRKNRGDRVEYFRLNIIFFCFSFQAKAVAYESSATFFCISAASLTSKYVNILSFIRSAAVLLMC